MGSVIVGEIKGSYGIKGWVKIHSFTAPPENILHYAPWLLDARGVIREMAVVTGKLHGQAVVALLEGIATPEDAQSLRGAKILVDRSSFPPALPGEFYRIDLLGLEVRNLAGFSLGTVKDVMATGANDVLVLEGERERLVPFLQGSTVKAVELEKGEILVDWDENF